MTGPNPFDPRTGSRRTWSCDALPVGTISLHVSHRRGEGKRREVVRIRRIKVRAGGPVSGRWVDYATWWWQQHHGPVPKGKCVLHRDGDVTNDDPSNLFLGTHADRLALWHLRDPDRSAAQMERAHRGCAEWNRVRAEVRRLTAWLPSRWYPVDFDRKVVLNAPERKKLEVYAARGVPMAERREGPALAAVMGFPGLPASQACLLAAILGTAGVARWVPAAAALAGANEARHRRGWRPLTIGGFRCAMTGLRVRGLVVSVRRRIAEYSATERAAAERVAPCPWVPVLGRDLVGKAFAGFTKVHPDGTAITRSRRSAVPVELAELPALVLDHAAAR